MQHRPTRFSSLKITVLMQGVVLALATMPAIAPAQTEPFPTATPESQGISAANLAELTAVLEDYVEKELFVGVEAVIIKNRRLVYQRALGLRDREEEIPFTNNTICNIRSMTKPLTGAAAQILIDRGQLALDDRVSQYIPSFDNDTHRAITLRQVLTHRAGLPLTAFTESIDQYEDLPGIAEAVGNQELSNEPDSKFWYSDAGTDVLGAIVAQVAGMSLDEFVTKELLKPLGMTDSFYGLDADDPRFERIASLYIGAANLWSRFWTPKDGPLYPFAWGSQTIYGTPLDYAKFLAMWMDDGRNASGQQILSPAAVKRTLTPASRMSMLGSDAPFPAEFADVEVYYGQMSVLHMHTTDPMNSKPVIIGHSGSDGTIAWAWPAEDLMILMFTQSRGGTALLRIESILDRLIIHPDRAVVVEAVPEKYEPYIGTYIANFASFENVEFTVQMHNGKLALDIPSQMLFDLVEPAEDAAEAKWKFALVPDQVAVTFERDEVGNVNLLKLHQGGIVLDVPRKGSKLAADVVTVAADNPEAAAKLLATYRDDENGRDLTTFLDGDALCMQVPGMVVHLRATADPLRWQIKEAPGVILEFVLNDEQTQPISMTRVIGERRDVWPRVDPTETKAETEGDENKDGSGG